MFPKELLGFWKYDHFEKYKDLLPGSLTPGFKRPARVAVQFVEADYRGLVELAATEISEDEIREYYEANKESYVQLDLPEIPEFVIEKQVNPPPYDQPRIIFGKKSLLPKKEEDDKKAKQKKSKVKLPKKKKGEKYPFQLAYKQ